MTLHSDATVSSRLEAALDLSLNRYLPADDTPFAVGFSGGGDSTALLYALRMRAAQIHVFIVDHGLRDGSAEEALAAKLRAENWGFKAQVLTSYFGKLYSAIQEEARRFRYRLIADAMRALQLSYLVTGHTRDDQAETCLMRYDRKTDWRGAAGMAVKTYAPVWPELAGITVVRPLLAEARAALRSYNRAHGLAWAEDPSNENRNFTRIRTRDRLNNNIELRDLLLDAASDLAQGLNAERAAMKRWTKSHGALNPQGYIELSAVPPKHILMHFIRAVAGSGAMIDSKAVSELAVRMAKSDFKASTLGGAHIIKADKGYLIVCDPVSAKGRKDGPAALRPITLKAGVQIWDGRFWVECSGTEPLTIQPAWGHIERAHAHLKHVPAPARPTVPLILSENDEIICAGPYQDETLTVRWLGSERLFAQMNNQH